MLPGNYTNNDLRTINVAQNSNRISSFNIPTGLEVVLFKKDNFTGDTHVFTAGAYDLEVAQPKWDNLAYSVIVRKATTQ
jgi:hypothetical protein